MNDTSPLCREFLESYCIDLCFRTADRIRFVFFSELPEQEFEGITEQMNRGTARSGMLHSVLSSIGRWRRHEPNLNYEYEPWRRLRPEGLKPLSKLDDIQKQLSWECDLNTAMPGAGMAMQFAQRLGIGRYVPCVVVFTDVGQLRVDVMPVSDMTPHEIYAHVRRWVDSYYEVNREKIDRWSRIEKEVEELCRITGNSLWEMRRWREKAQRAWEDLSGCF